MFDICVRVGLKPNDVRKAVVKSVSCDQPIGSTRGLRRIFMETEDGLSTAKDGWCASLDIKVHPKEFTKTWKDIQSGAITAGTEVTIEYNPDGIMCFYLNDVKGVS